MCEKTYYTSTIQLKSAIYMLSRLLIICAIERLRIENFENSVLTLIERRSLTPYCIFHYIRSPGTYRLHRLYGLHLLRGIVDERTLILRRLVKLVEDTWEVNT
jgi:hypothetical protein